jgi:hypothetical protein
MLENLSEQIRNCYEHAEFCARKATEQSDPLLKRDYLELEQRWLTLARSYDLSERASDFTDEARRFLNRLPKPSSE